MKKKILFINLLFLGVLMYSCSSEEMVYSCDPEINQWTKENLEMISTINRNDFLSYNYNTYLQKGIYAALTPDQKMTMWQEKILEVLKISWSDKETTHIKSLQNIIEKHPYFFYSDLSPELEEEIDLISYRWIEYAKEELGWGMEEIYPIAMTINSIYKTGDRLFVDENSDLTLSLLKTSVELSCSCDKTSGMTGGACPSGYTCTKGNCTKVRNCGLLGASECIGLCTKN